MKRVLTALVLVPVVLAVVLWAPLWLFTPLLLAVALVAGREFFDLAEAQGLAPYRWLGLVAIAAVVLSMALPWAVPTLVLAPVLVACMLAVLLRALMLPEAMAHTLGSAGATMLGIVYLGLCMGATGAIRLEFGSAWLIFLLLVVWLGDTAALYGGRLFGRHAMSPRVSPKKTWEGGAASLLAGFAVGGAFGHWFVGHTLRYGALAVLINVAAQGGDLVESLFKRGAGVKDSGTLLPGHGGMLDRIDAMLLAAPVLWYYVAYFPR
ncbi:MAG TPA: phosphatidate cytidylyltransferase [Terriglobales bacterium]|nr:phosphatidate cytidylyltransferase [Terriglobales bacterium]